VLFQIGYIYYNKGYYKEALDEFEHALDVRKKLAVNVDLATTYRFLGETLTRLGADFERAKLELSKYHSIALKINDLVEIQRAHTTLGNYFMTLAESNYKDKRKESLNEAYSHYLKSYDLINEIADKRLVDTKELNLIKARTCLNCGL
jgi:tetratricopeptide (TPR) repeat protein